MDTAGLATPRRTWRRAPDGEMAVLDFGDPKRPVDLIFLHANGFNALTYRTLLAPLSVGLRILAPDLRGHGRTRLPVRTRGRFDWHDHRDDLVALLDELDGPPVVLAGHSMGGVSALLAAAERPDAVSSLVLLDPVIFPAPAHLAFRLPLLRRLSGRSSLAQRARRRRRLFSDQAEALSAYRGRGAFRGWPEAVLIDYLTDGLVAAPDGDGLILTCDPEWEASNYGAQGHDPWRALRRVERPVRILKAEIASTCSVRPGPDRDVVVQIVERGTHLFPMVRPDLVRTALLDACM